MSHLLNTSAVIDLLINLSTDKNCENICVLHMVGLIISRPNADGKDYRS